MNAPELIFSDVMAYVDQAEKLLAAGNVRDLKALDETVDHLARRLRQLTADQITEYEPEIAHLRERMQALTQQMAGAQNQISEALKTVTSHHRAAKAYLSTPES